MANDARTQFVDGLRVTADHLQHLQDRLREAVRDLRYVVGTRAIAWGLHVTADAGTVTVTPGVAFAPSGVRLSLDAVATAAVPAGPGPWRVTLQAIEQDRAALRVGDRPTLILLVTSLGMEPSDDPEPGPDALVIATVTVASDGVLGVVQDPALFVASGSHGHSGEFRQDADGRWRFDGAALAAGTGGAGPPGPKGDKGDRGDAGPPGAAGQTGAAGAAGSIGPKGDPGTPGATGSIGLKGDKGDKGDRGDAGSPGVAGQTGAAGAAGSIGPKGDKGDRGDTGPPGAAGQTGAAGAAGLKGDPGATGPIGPVGPRGDGLDPNPTFISKLSWPQGTTLTLTAAQALVRELRIDTSGPLNDAMNAQPAAIQVWFLPAAATATTGQPAAIQIIHGSPKFDRTGVTWSASEPAAIVRAMFGPGGQVLLRVHCGFIFDDRERPLSAALTAITPFPNKAPIYGGTFESWFFVQAGVTGTD